MKCPSCGASASGNFCPSCGASLRARKCESCSAELVAGARFCNRCGAPAGAAGGAGGAAAGAGAATGSRRGRAAADDEERASNAPWYVAGALLTVLIIILLVPLIRGDDDAALRTPVGTGAFPGVTAPGTPPPLTGTPREQADRLFNRIMTAREAGDMASAQMFVPMATQAYESARPLDYDGLYHLALVHTVGGSYDLARQTAEQILERNPNHLLALAAAAEAAELAGDNTAAQAYHARFLDAWDTESARPLQEYQDHAGVLPEYRQAARNATGR